MNSSTCARASSRPFRYATRRWMASLATGCEHGADANGDADLLDQVLVDATPLVQQAQCGFEAVRQRPALRVCQRFGVDASHGDRPRRRGRSW